MAEDKKPKVEGGARPQRTQTQRESRKEYRTEVVGLQEHTFDVGAAKYAAKFTKSLELEEIANYVQKEYTKGGGRIGQAIKDMVEPTIDLPQQPTGTGGNPPTAVEIFVWQEDYKTANTERKQYQENKQRAYALVWGQCSPELRNKVKSAATYGTVSSNHDVVGLLRLIRGFCCSFDDQRQGTWALQQAKKRAFCYLQRENMSNADYMEEFEAIIKVVETYGGEWGQEPGLVRAKLQAANVPDVDNPTDDELENAKDAAREEFLAMMFLRGADRNRYWKLRDELSNDYAKGVDNYPTTLDGMLRLLNNYKGAGNPVNQRGNQNHRSELSFLQNDNKGNGCWHCGAKGQVIEEGTDNLNIQDEGQGTNEGIDNLNIHEWNGYSMLHGSGQD